MFRNLLFCFFASIGIGAAQADDAAAPPTGEKAKTAAPVEAGITFDWVHVDGPYIAMTFDDGPSAKLTPKLLDLLAAHHIKATFFLIGQNVAENPEIVAREAREGHEVANHSWSHPRFKRGLQSHRQEYARRVNRFGARHSSGHNRGDAMRAESTRGQRI